MVLAYYWSELTQWVPPPLRQQSADGPVRVPKFLSKSLYITYQMQTHLSCSHHDDAWDNCPLYTLHHRVLIQLESVIYHIHHSFNILPLFQDVFQIFYIYLSISIPLLSFLLSFIVNQDLKNQLGLLSVNLRLLFLLSSALLLDLGSIILPTIHYIHYNNIPLKLTTTPQQKIEAQHISWSQGCSICFSPVVFCYFPDNLQIKITVLI